MSESRFSRAACDHCGEHIEFPQDGLGLVISCPHCHEDTLLAEIDSAPAEIIQAEITAAELKESLQGTLPARRVSFVYQLGLLIVTIFMVLLPLIYFALIAGLGYGVYWYGIHARGLLSNAIGGFYIIILEAIAYFGPLIGGSLAVFFMFKPIFARPRQQAEPLELNPAKHPRLYQFIAHISDLLRVPIPGRIYLNCELNASAGLRRGLLSFGGNDLVLILGLPLVAGLNTRQLAAVVAHELGHCTQAFAMRLGYVIGRIDQWFVRVVYARDTWDDMLDDWSNSANDWRLALVVGCIRLSVWFSRAILSTLLHLGHAAQCFLSRQMEFHADSCAAAIAGSDGLESLLVRLREQGIVQNLAFNELGKIWKQKRKLPDNFPEFMTEWERRMPPHFHEEARMTLLNEKVGWFATHPSSAQRIQKARRQGDAGIFILEKPARLLFNDFEATARLVTGIHLQLNLRLPVTDAMLKPVSEFFPKDTDSPANP